MGHGQNGILEQVNSLCIHSFFFSLYVDISYQLLVMNYNFDFFLQRLIDCFIMLVSGHVLFSSKFTMSFLMTNIAVIVYLSYS